MSVKENTMDKKIIHEVKLPRVITVALYAIAIGLLANLFKPVVMGNPAFADYLQGDLSISITSWPQLGTCELCQ
jgi:hypothetical protein